MEVIQFLVDLFSNQDSLFKIILITLISVYGFFALILAIQIRNLNKVINQVAFSPIFTLLARAHLVVTLALLGFTVVFL